MIGMYIKLTKRVAEDASRMDRLRQPLAIADVMADIIKQRVQFDGESIGQRKTPPKYETGIGAYWLLAGVKTGVRDGGGKRDYYPIKHPTGWAKVQNRWGQAGRDPASFAFTGGMWSGLRVASSGDAARIRFAGSSMGRDGKRVPNAAKAGRVYTATRINVLEPTAAEIQAAGEALGIEAGRIAAQLLGAETASGRPVAGILVARFVESLRE